MLGRDRRRQVVMAADAAAQRLGLRVGMPATTARVLVPDLTALDHEALADAEGLERLAVWMLQRYAPIVTADPPDGIILDVAGADHLHGGEAAMLAGMVARLGRAGLLAKAAIADTWGAAHALARFTRGPTCVVPMGGAQEAIADLPLASLRLPQDVLEGLRVLGFVRVSDLWATPRAPLTLRFGPELGRRLDQALGHASEPIDPIRPADLIEVRRSFPEPIGAPETLARYIGKLVVQLCEGLTAQGVGAKRLDLICHRVDNTLQALRVGTAVPVRDVQRLTRLLTDKIETIEPGFGIEILSLTATLVEPLAARQVATSLVEESVPDVSDLVDILANRVGEHSIYRAAPVASDVPERSVRRIAAMTPETGETWPGHWPRPARLLQPPERIETLALLPDHPPVWFTWRGIRRRVHRADGPERVFGEWWKRDPELAAVRDYFQLEDDAGERYWVFRAGDGEDAATGSHRWFLHGVFG